MIESDTIKLLRECDAGIKMGVASIEDVLDYVSNTDLKNISTVARMTTKSLKIKFSFYLINTTMTAKTPTLWRKVCRGLKQI